PIGQSGFFGAQVEVGTGAFNLSAPLPFGVTVYGFNTFDSYGYPGGLALASVAPVAGLALTPETAAHRVAQLHQGVATRADAAARHLRGVGVDFRVAGGKELLGFGVADESGLAHFSYVGTNPGTDTLTASVGDVADTAQVNWTVPLPTLFVTRPLDGSTLDAGTPVVVSGVALASRPVLPGGQVYPNEIIQVTINGVPADALDAAGQFFGQ